MVQQLHADKERPMDARGRERRECIDSDFLKVSKTMNGKSQIAIVGEKGFPRCHKGLRYLLLSRAVSICTSPILILQS